EHEPRGAAGIQAPEIEDRRTDERIDRGLGCTGRRFALRRREVDLAFPRESEHLEQPDVRLAEIAGVAREYPSFGYDVRAEPELAVVVERGRVEHELHR